MHNLVTSSGAGKHTAGKYLPSFDCSRQRPDRRTIRFQSHSEGSKPFFNQGCRRKSIQSPGKSHLAYAISTGADGENRPAYRETQTAADAKVCFGSAARTAPYV